MPVHELTKNYINYVYLERKRVHRENVPGFVNISVNRYKKNRAPLSQTKNIFFNFKTLIIKCLDYEKKTNEELLFHE